MYDMPSAGLIGMTPLFVRRSRPVPGLWSDMTGVGLIPLQRTCADACIDAWSPNVGEEMAACRELVSRDLAHAHLLGSDRMHSVADN
jgi:hypothetical protein